MLTPVKPAGKNARNVKRRVGPTGPDDPFWGIIGIADPYLPPDAPTDVSENKYKYLAEPTIYQRTVANDECPLPRASTSSAG